MERIRHDELNVIHAPASRHLQDLFDHPPPDVGRLHRWQGQRDVIERDGQAHARLHQLGQRIGSVRVEQRMADATGDVADRWQ